MGSFLLSNAILESADSDIRAHVSRLRLLAKELTDVAEVLESVEDAITSQSQFTNPSREYLTLAVGAQSKPDMSILVRIAESLRASLSARNECFESGTFGEPAWEILLELFVNQSSGRRLTVTGLCSGTSVPQTTALRYVEILERQGLLQRTKSKSDKRVTWIGLSAEGIATMNRCLSQWWRCFFEQG